MAFLPSHSVTPFLALCVTHFLALCPRLAPDVSNRRPFIEAVLALDNELLWADLVSQGWKADTSLTGTWNATTVASFFHAKRCLALMKQAGAVITELEFKPIDISPVPLTKELPSDLRPSDQDHPAVVAQVSGVVDETGTLRCISTSVTENFTLDLALRKALAAVKFSPARRGDTPVPAELLLHVPLAAQPKQIYANHEHDLPAVELNPRKRRSSEFLKPERGLAAMSENYGGGIGEALYALGTSGVTNNFAANRDSDGRLLPRLRFLVCEDGLTRYASVLRAENKIEGEDALRYLATRRYLPAVVDGRPVSTWETAYMRSY